MKNIAKLLFGIDIIKLKKTNLPLMTVLSSQKTEVKICGETVECVEETWMDNYGRKYVVIKL